MQDLEGSNAKDGEEIWLILIQYLVKNKYINNKRQIIFFYKIYIYISGGHRLIFSI